MNTVTFPSTTLKKALATMSRVVKKNTVLSILESVMIVVKDGTATFSASDLEMTVSLDVPCTDASGSFRMCIPLADLKSLADQLPNEPVVMSYDVEEQHVEITCEDTVIVLATEKSDDFPKTPKLTKKDPEPVVLPEQAMAKLHIASEFVAKDSLRPAMSGVLMHILGKEFMFVATDQHRLYRSERMELSFIDLSHKLVEIQLVMSSSSAAALTAFKMDGEIKMGYSETHIFFQNETLRFAARLVDAKFPDYRAVLPDFDSHFLVDLATVRATIRLVGITADKTTSSVAANLEGGKLILTSQDLDFGKSGKKTIPTTGHQTCDDMKFAFNYVLLDTILSNIAGDLKWKLYSPTRAMVLVGSESADTFLLMPLMIGGQ